jgi:5-methylcytosine-specific restriction endonuclease McrA
MRLTAKDPCKTCGKNPRYVTPKGKVSSRCRACNSAAASAWNAAHAEHRASYTSSWRRDHREYLTQRNREWRAANPERAKAIAQRQRENSPDAVRANAKRWREANPDKERDKALLRIARQRGVWVEKVSRAEVWERDGGICHICQTPADPDNWHLDHVTPLILGGPHSYANTAVSHPFCNLSKGGRSGPLGIDREPLPEA